MGETSSPELDLEGLEERQEKIRGITKTRRESGNRGENRSQLSWPMADLQLASHALCLSDKILRSTETPPSGGSVTLNPPNRRMRTRMYGGVTGKAGDSLPMSIGKGTLAKWFFKNYNILISKSVFGGFYAP